MSQQTLGQNLQITNHVTIFPDGFALGKGKSIVGLYRFREIWVGPMERCMYKGRIKNQGIGGDHLGQGDIHTHWVLCKAEVANFVGDLAIPKSDN